MEHRWKWIATGAACALAWLLAAQSHPSGDARLWHYRNLGKAFYENPTTQKQAVDILRQALALAPNSARERLNYGLALLRAGDAAGGHDDPRRVGSPSLLEALQLLLGVA